MNATESQALQNCQTLEPLVLLRIYRGCDFKSLMAKFNATANSSAPVPEPSGASRLSLALSDAAASGLVPAGVVKTGQDAAAAVTETVGDVRNSRFVATVREGGASAGQVVDAAVSDLRNIFTIRG